MGNKSKKILFVCAYGDRIVRPVGLEITERTGVTYEVVRNSIRALEQNLNEIRAIVQYGAERHLNAWEEVYKKSQKLGVRTIIVSVAPELYGSRADHCIRALGGLDYIVDKIIEFLNLDEV